MRKAFVRSVLAVFIFPSLLLAQNPEWWSRIHLSDEYQVILQECESGDFLPPLPTGPILTLAKFGAEPEERMVLEYVSLVKLGECTREETGKSKSVATVRVRIEDEQKLKEFLPLTHFSLLAGGAGWPHPEDDRTPIPSLTLEDLKLKR